MSTSIRSPTNSGPVPNSLHRPGAKPEARRLELYSRNLSFLLAFYRHMDHRRHCRGAAAFEIIPHKKAHHGDREHDAAKDEAYDGIAAPVATLFNDFNCHDVCSIFGFLPVETNGINLRSMGPRTGLSQHLMSFSLVILN